MEAMPCQYPACRQESIDQCERCRSRFCSRHIWKELYRGGSVVLCYSCHELGAQERRARIRERAAYVAIVTVLLFIGAGVSDALHGLRHMDATLTKWAFWLFVAGFVVSLSRLTLLLLSL